MQATFDTYNEWEIFIPRVRSLQDNQTIFCQICHQRNTKFKDKKFPLDC